MKKTAAIIMESSTNASSRNVSRDYPAREGLSKVKGSTCAREKGPRPECQTIPLMEFLTLIIVVSLGAYIIRAVRKYPAFKELFASQCCHNTETLQRNMEWG